MLNQLRNKLISATALVLLAGSGAAHGQQPAVRIGVIAEFSGPFADYGTQIVNGMKTYLKLHGDGEFKPLKRPRDLGDAVRLMSPDEFARRVTPGGGPG